MVGVLVKRFPKLSETFILNEILGLEAKGQKLHVFALEPPSDEVVNPAVARVKAPVEQIDRGNGWTIARTLFGNPLGFVRGASAALREFGLRDGPAVAQAFMLSSRMRRAGIAHLHAHFADRPAAIARVACAISGVPFSISAHAKDIYLEDAQRLKSRLRAAKFTVTCTGHNAIHLRQLEPSARVHRLYHGVDTLGLPARGAPGGSLPPLILSVGRLRPKKGFDTLVEACGELARNGQNFRCIIAGYGPEEGRLRELIGRHGLGERIHLAGKLPHEAVLALMAQASAFALPCRVEPDGDRDGIPNVLLEAMAVGAPVVSTRISGIPELISDGDNGLLVAPDDPGGMANAIQRILGDERLAKDIAARGQRTVLDRFSLDGDIGALNRLLEDAINPSAPRARVGYVLKGFPRLSESFIANEIRLLEQMGLSMHIFAIKPGDTLGAQALSEISTPITYVPGTTSLSKTTLVRWLTQNLSQFIGPSLRLLARRPASFLRVLARAVAMTRRYRETASQTPRYAFIKEFLQAAYIADRSMTLRGVTHLHGHFCHGATTVTQFVSELTGRRFSFTAHAKDIYEPSLNPGDLLNRKFAAARFAVTCTGANHAHLKEKGVDCCQLHTIYHGLDTSLFSPSRHAATTKAPLILTVGRYVEKKGFLNLISACAILAKRGLSFQCRIVGEEGNAGPAMRELIAQEGLQDIVVLTPPAAQRELREIYAQATVFALPCLITDSGDRDGIPNVLAEAMAMQLPVVTTGVSGIPELVHDRITGRLVPPNNAGALADTLEEIITASTDERRALGVAARAIIEERFDSHKTTTRLKSLFDGALLEASR